MEAKNALPFSGIERKFEFFDIKWIVEKFCLVLCKENWTILSPEFCAERPFRTNWAIELRSVSNLDCREVSFILKRLDIDTGPVKVWVDLRLRFMTETNCTFYTDSITYCFDEASEYKMPVQFIEDLRFLEESSSIKFDLLIVGCEMIIYNEDIRNRFKPCSDIGLKSLSEDLLSMYNSIQYHDVKLKFDDHDIRVHLAILQARCKKLRNFIELSCDIKSELSKNIYVMGNSNFTYEPVNKVLAYLYSGDLNHVHEEPSIDIYEYALQWNIEEITDFYSPDKITFRTSMQIHEHAFNWMIGDFNDKYARDVQISSLSFREDDFSTTWRLHLYPTSQEDPEYVALFAEIFDDMPLLDAYLELAFVNYSGNHLLSKIVQCSDRKVKKFGFMKFVKKDMVKYYVVNNILRITFKLRLTTGNKESVFESQVSTLKTCPKTDVSFISLSENLKTLLSNGHDVDAFLKSHDIKLPVHKSILAARCPNFRNMFVDSQEFVEMFDVSSIKPDTLNHLLTYVYTGVFPRNLEYGDLVELKKAATNFGLKILESSCSQTLDEKRTM